MKRLFFGALVIAAQLLNAQDIYNKARAQLEARDTSGAFSTFRDAVKAGQKLAESHYHLGAILFSRHQTKDAIDHLLASFAAEDENVDVARLLGDAYLEQKDLKNALNFYRVATRLAPKDCGITIAYGQALVEADSMDPAIIQLTRAKECAPENPLIYLSLGDAYYKIGVKPLAITNYEKASELAPKDLEIRLKVARALAANKEWADAIKAYIRAEEIDSTQPDPYFEHGLILVRAARSATAAGKKQEFYRYSLAPLGSFVKLSPKDVDGSVLYAEALFGANQSIQNMEAAATAAKAALDLDSSNVDMWRIRAHSLVETRDFKGALESFAALERRKAIQQADQIKLGQAYFGAGMDAQALDAFQKAMETDSANCDIYFPVGSLWMKKQDYPRAAEMFEKKIACEPRSLSAYINGAICYMQPANLSLPRARELLLNSIELKGDFLQGRLWLARYYVQVDSLDLAEEQYLEVLKIIGDQVDKNKSVYGEAQRLLGSLYMMQQKYLKAIDAFRKAQSVGQDDANSHLSWGQAILQTLNPSPKTTEEEENNRKITSDALDHFLLCIKKDPGSCLGHFWVGECYVRLRIPGNDDENAKLKKMACEEWRTVLKLCPKNEDAKKGLERIGCP